MNFDLAAAIPIMYSIELLYRIFFGKGLLKIVGVDKCDVGKILFIIFLSPGLHVMPFDLPCTLSKEWHKSYIDLKKNLYV